MTLDWNALLETITRARHPVLMALSRSRLESFYEFARRAADAGGLRVVVIRCSSVSTGGICKDPAVIDVFLSRSSTLSRLKPLLRVGDPQELAGALRLIASETLLPPRESSRVLALAELLDEHPARNCCAPVAEVALGDCSADKVRGLVELEAAASEKCGTTIVVVEERRHAHPLLDEKLPPTAKLLLYWGPAPLPSLHSVDFAGPRDLAKSLRGVARAVIEIGEGHVVILGE
uniref:Uncharacterized protein n=1 Tax=Thermofilum pendens TaxID=2269 RepID=A0A7C4FE05_THEPE